LRQAAHVGDDDVPLVWQGGVQRCIGKVTEIGKAVELGVELFGYGRGRELNEGCTEKQT